jgi:hypothetical protein
VTIETIEEFISKDKLKSSDESTVLYEGLLMRYMPGFSRHFHAKYCVITKKIFAYYKNKLQAYEDPLRPLGSFKIADIEFAQRVQVFIPEEKHIVKTNAKKGRVKQGAKPKHFLEIFLKQDDNQKGVEIKGNESQITIKRTSKVPQVIPSSNDLDASIKKEETISKYFQSEYLASKLFTDNPQVTNYNHHRNIL